MALTNKLINLIIFCIIGYLIWIFATGYQEFALGASKTGIKGMLILLLLSVFNYLTRFLRWHWMIMKVNNTKVDILHHSRVYFSSLALTATPGKVGEAIRAYYLKPIGIPVNSTLAALLSERILDISSILLLSIVAIMYFTDYRWIAFTVLIIIIMSVVIIRSNWLTNLLNKRLALTQTIFIKKLLKLTIETINSTREYLSNKIWCYGLLIGLLSWGAEAFGFYLLIKWLTGEDLLYIAVGVYSFSMIIGAISLLPGGIGSAELTMTGLLLLLGISLSDATTATIICRLVTLWFAVIIGIYFLHRLNATDIKGEENERG